VVGLNGEANNLMAFWWDEKLMKTDDFCYKFPIKKLFKLNLLLYYLKLTYI
jgi:hypothetical protein